MHVYVLLGQADGDDVRYVDITLPSVGCRVYSTLEAAKESVHRLYAAKVQGCSILDECEEPFAFVWEDRADGGSELQGINEIVEIRRVEIDSDLVA